MRVLWFTNTMALYEPEIGVQRFGYNGGGWITSAQKLIMSNDDIILGVCFQMQGQPWKSVQNGVAYYPIKPTRKSRFKDLFKTLINSRDFSYEADSWDSFYDECRKVLDDFKPDIIHVFGSEREFGLVANITKTPIVLHLQGVISPYWEAFMPPSMSWRAYLFSNINLTSIVKKLLVKTNFQRAAYREKTILRTVKYYMGRTTWDECVTKAMNSHAEYFHCDEVLRDTFYEKATRKLPDKLTIVTTISSPPYKGMDLVLKTAKLLKENLIADFEWYLYGITDCRYMEKFCHINHKAVNIRIMGVVTAEELKEMELRTTIYVQPSYIENSSNSLCEAQMLGVTCIATNVGGISSLIENGKTGFLIPANDPYQLAYLINKLYKEKALNTKIGNAAQKIALARHDKTEIANNIISIYKQIIEASQR